MLWEDLVKIFKSIQFFQVRELFPKNKMYRPTLKLAAIKRYTFLTLLIFLMVQIGNVYKIYFHPSLHGITPKSLEEDNAYQDTYKDQAIPGGKNNGKTHTLRKIGINLDRHYDEIYQYKLEENQMITVALWGMVADLNHIEDKCQGRLFCNFIKAADKDHVSRADFTVVNMNFLTQYLAAFPVRNASQKLILTHRESPARKESTSFLTEYDGIFNFTAYYNQRADAVFAYGECIETTELPNEANYARNRSHFAFWMVSNCNPVNKRWKYVQVLQKHIQIDVYGKCGTHELPNCNLPRYSDTFHKCKEYDQQVISQYKFYLAFENSFCEDYITEKAFIATRGTFHPLPVMMGGGDYDKYFPPNSYLDVRNFSSPEALVKWMQYLDQNDQAYNSYFQWKHRYYCVWPDYFCSLCKSIYGLRNKRNVVNNLEEVFTNKQCVSPATYYKGWFDAFNYL